MKVDMIPAENITAMRTEPWDEPGIAVLVCEHAGLSTRWLMDAEVAREQVRLWEHYVKDANRLARECKQVFDNPVKIFFESAYEYPRWILKWPPYVAPDGH